MLMGWGGYVLSMNLKTWKNLNDEEKNVVRRAADEATKWNEINNMKYIKDTIAGLKKRGVITAVLTSEEKARWSKLVEEVYNEQSESMRALIKEVRGK